MTDSTTEESEIPPESQPLPPPIAPGRLDTQLARLAASAEMRGPLAFEPARLSPDHLVALYARPRPGNLEFLKTQIENLGGSATPVGASALAVRLPAASLPSFARLESLERAEASMPNRPLLDRSLPEIGADRVVRGEGLATPLTGKGVILGLVDSGLEYPHPAFLDKDKVPRVLAIWSQNTEGTPPPGREIGHLCDRAQIVDFSCPPLDIMAHGTHVAATAGSSDRDYPGVAPDVDFVSSGSLTFELLAEAAAWVFDVADEYGRPAVINMSLGGHFGAHDGSSIEEQILTEISGPGRIIVVAAGNDGGRNIHLSYPLKDEPGETELLLYPGFFSEGGFVDVWNEPEGYMALEVALVDSAGEIVTSTGFHDGNDEPFSGELLDEQDRTMGQVQIIFEPHHNDTGKERASIYLVPSRDPNTYTGNPDGFRWILRMSGQGVFHAWISSASFGSAPASFGLTGNPGDNLSVVAMPGTAPGVITVAAYSTRGEWTDIDGNHVEHPSITLGDIAMFSSGGPAVAPSRTGRKPEIAAPGEFIAAPYGTDGLIFDRRTLLDIDIAAMRGTSMATPHVAGVVALMLEARPDLDREEIMEILMETSTVDKFTGETPNNLWGYGKIDAYRAAMMLIGPEVPKKTQGGCGCSASAFSNTDQGSLPATFILLALALLMLRPKREYSKIL